jgi:hypothetical protein
MTTPRPAWQSHLSHYASDVISAIGQSPAAIHAFFSAFTSHPDHGPVSRPGAVAAVVIMLAVIVTLTSWVKAKASRSS